ncbi:pentatricopeptide repeat-containing protein At1g77360, mitochondrial-like isoform X1 [Trifolium pratense]|uniref:pentatricopeptide repeat-containing protein At1g77360, mitochondrial-like isoform X1 n=1 Tax=Trifolium pratense TaxID=57577 RepID=UPI001E693695|nr:pentatricopeptide repeat-containing protein At1g77360, mitochondrial-like isoform X1 [Trifolium pratense]
MKLKKQSKCFCKRRRNMSVNRKRSYDSMSSPSSSTSLLQTNTTLSRLPRLSKTKSLFEIISTNPFFTVEKTLEDSCIDVTPQDIEQVLKLSYRFPAQAFKFFRWASNRINHTPYAWNLVIDILGKNRSFKAMWTVVKSMSRIGLLSRSTFASIFASYVNVGRLADAVRTFEVMNRYGCVQDVISLNSLMSAICDSGRVIEACNYLQTANKFVRPDYDTYAILMEGLESDGNVVGAKENFYDMIFEIAWDPANFPAYDLFLCTLAKGSDGIHEALKFFDLLRDRGCYPGIRFFGIVLDECVRFNDIRRAEFFWEIMLGKTKLQPTTAMYNSMISMYCYHSDIDAAMNMLDGMVCKGAFPNSLIICCLSFSSRGRNWGRLQRCLLRWCQMGVCRISLIVMQQLGFIWIMGILLWLSKFGNVW